MAARRSALWRCPEMPIPNESDVAKSTRNTWVPCQEYFGGNGGKEKLRERHAAWASREQGDLCADTMEGSAGPKSVNQFLQSRLQHNS